ncbi:cellulase family glycosylhydrolase [Cesiribacter andamanensis]|uniref:cellulase family glycosylhydrolase n=1 Tax=Cesiribacter andamanensis TaxID=649507 RepID=UPI00373FCD86
MRAKIEELIGPEKTNDFYSAWLANHTRRIDVDSMAAWGFNSVRLAMHYKLFTPPIKEEPVKGEITWREEGFALTDSLLAWCTANRMYLILDLHAAPGGQGHDAAISDYDEGKPSLWESPENQRKTIALWRRLAERYKDEPWIGGYDIINEPNWGFQNPEDRNGCNEKGNEPLKKLLVEITQAIREVDQNHIIMIEGNCWGNNYSNMLPPWDDNMVISFHKYWNYNTQEAIQGMLDTRQTYNVPIWLGETGENSNHWFTEAIELFEQNRMGWAWWPLKKLGFNNPLEIELNEGYRQLLAYWRGEAPRPTEKEAYNALMQLAEATKLENCIYHKGVIDAMFRQVHSAEALPFKEHRIQPGSHIDAVDYDMGKQGIAYWDTDAANYYISTGGERQPWNRGRHYRNDGVDIALNEDGKGYHVAWIETGEWLQYTVTVDKPATYRLAIRVGTENPGGKLQLLVNDRPHGSAREIPVPAGPQQVGAVVYTALPLPAGTHRLRLVAEQGGFTLHSLQFLASKLPPPSPPKKRKKGAAN